MIQYRLGELKYCYKVQRSKILQGVKSTLYLVVITVQYSTVQYITGEVYGVSYALVEGDNKLSCLASALYSTLLQ